MGNRFVVVIPSFKNVSWYKRNLASVLSQDYDDFRVVYTDDCSPDKTGELVEKYLAANDSKSKVTLHRNQNRIGALKNLYDMIHACDDDEIIVTLDGDDWFAHPNVLKRLAQEYKNPDVWMTYGQYRSQPDNRIGCCQLIPPAVIQSNSYRRYRWCSSHLRTFYTWLFKKVRREDLLDRHGDFYPMAWDLAFMMPMLEMSGPRAKFIPDVLYAYNVSNPINDSKVNVKLQQGLEMEIRRKKPYGRLQSAG